MRIGIILGSVREKRSGERVARWAERKLAEIHGVEPVLLDLKEFDLPFYSEALNPNDIETYSTDSANRWAAAVAGVDGFLILVAEYNHGYTGVLKNALDYLYKEWNGKPAAMLSYSSGMMGGARAVEQLRPTLSHLKLVALPEVLHLGKVTEVLNEAGEVQSGPFDEILSKQLVELVRWTKLLREQNS